MPNISERLSRLFGRNVYYLVNSSEQSPTVEGMSPRQLYATQANLHAVVSFLSESIAQLPLKVYVRDAETERRRDRESPAAKLLYKPNKDQTAYEFWSAISTELLLMGCATVWRLPDTSESGYQLRIIPKEWIVQAEGETNYAPSKIRVTSGTGQYIDIPESDFTQFRLYAPGNPGGYLSPVAALKQTLVEQVNADRFRTSIWKSSGRFNGYVTRPANVQPWDNNQRETWIKTFREGWGANGANRGQMPLLEDGM